MDQKWSNFWEFVSKIEKVKNFHDFLTDIVKVTFITYLKSKQNKNIIEKLVNKIQFALVNVP